MFSKEAFSAQKCNSNDDCRGTWICVNGTANNGNSQNAVFTGVCMPNMVVREVCLVYDLIRGIFGTAATLLAIALFGGKILFNAGVGGIKWQELLALLVGMAFIFGGPQIIGVIIQSTAPICDFRGV